MQAQAKQDELKTTLLELEQLHAQEALALRALDRDALDGTTDQKVRLWERLKAVTEQVSPQAEDRAQLERIRQAALLNQILLHHARDAVRTILENATGVALAPPSNRPHAVQDGLRVDFKG